MVRTGSFPVRAAPGTTKISTRGGYHLKGHTKDPLRRPSSVISRSAYADLSNHKRARRRIIT